MLLSFLKFLVHIFCEVVFFVKLVGKENLPKEGPVILAVNHTSLWDPPVLIASVPRHMRVMAKKELFDHKMLKPILNLADAFPVTRGANDIGAIKTALQTLKNGDVFAIFPSGRRVLANESSEAKAGVALIAARSGAPVIPVAMRGGYRLFRQVKIYFGEPVSIHPKDGKRPTGEELQAFADEIMKRIDSLGV